LDLKKTPYDVDSSGFSVYGTSKLANILFIKELQRRLEGSTAVANSFEPGMVYTSFSANLGWLANLVFWLFGKTPEQGADSLVWLATSEEAGVLKGQHVSKRVVINPKNAQAVDAKLAKDLWELSERLCQNQ
jgi:NAD(P)-dependent dehydrogenase (short-subunit alcohol dehydrogenase family)